MNPLLVAGLVVGSMFKDELFGEKTEPVVIAPPAQPYVPPERFTMVRPVPGGSARYVHPSSATHVLRWLAGAGLEPIHVSPNGQQPYGPVFRLVQLVPGGSSASRAVQLATEQGLVSVCSLSCLGRSPETRFLMFIKPADRPRITTLGQWAILWDGSAFERAPAANPPQVAAPPEPTKTENPLANLPEAIATEISDVIARKDEARAKKLALELRKYGLTAAATLLETRVQAAPKPAPTIEEILESGAPLNGVHKIVDGSLEGKKPESSEASA
jgi:hypothetical protein